MVLLEDVTFIIPIRKDSIERFENLLACISFIQASFYTKILVIEAAPTMSIADYVHKKYNVSTIYVEDNDPVFHRTKFINVAVNQVHTPIVAIWDSDVIVHQLQIISAINDIRGNKCEFVYPYDGRFLDTSPYDRKAFLHDLNIDRFIKNVQTMNAPYGFTACGGGFLALLKEYKACGLENEKFYGWGQEDGERVKRWLILGRQVRRVIGPMFHLCHPRGINSYFLSDLHKYKQIGEYERISNMNRERLLKEIETWH